MTDALPTSTTTQDPKSVAPPARSTLGSLAIAMIMGAILAVVLLYWWGAEIAKEEQEASVQVQQ